ncbi:sensor histidine kinase [Flavihumibacter petaseus]|uniref:Putative two-component histidine kinase n=1 Tax=Flavihumibacter petaseus NBRC 106054 TaxID=1220578 RepID=A0A0E9MUQ6_9BACT|nr:histidine kinase [Flavihumibacter petaseus]GAO41477.1 putative two-component histidine kinase [Flavihumibacter petaseus NBRC 106054]
MTLHELIFSRNKGLVIRRHCIFWTGRLIFLIYNYYLVLYLQNDTLPSDALTASFTGAAIQLAGELPFTYGILYLIFSVKTINVWVKTMLITIITIGAALLSFVLTGGDSHRPENQSALLYYWPAVWGYVGYGAPVVTAIFAMFRLLKQYAATKISQASLLHENQKAELELLKAQLQPHFLFNTLNTIYATSLEEPAHAAGMVSNLKSSFRYLLQQSRQPSVQLDDELDMLRHYEQLELSRFGHRLQLDHAVSGDTGSCQIAPLLLLPLVENSFKHSVADTRGNAWIRVMCNINNGIMEFSVRNSCQPERSFRIRKGIGLSNLRRRLELLYPGKFLLITERSNHQFFVRLQLHLIPNASNPMHRH